MLIKQFSNDKSFTLIELLIVIGILAVLAVVVILILNPVEFIKQSRDSVRLSDLATLHKALGIYQAQGNTGLGTSNTVYVSVPDSSATCANLGLPSLPSGWSYACVASSTLRNVDSTGWVPVNLTLSAGGSPLGTLPIDPVNTTSTGEYYTYTAGGSWILTAIPESQKYRLGGSNQTANQITGAFLIGTDLTLSPIFNSSGLVGYWKFEEGSGTLYDSSGYGNNGTQSGGVTYGATGKVGYALSFDGSDDYVNTGIVPTGIVNAHSIGFWVKSTSAILSPTVVSIWNNVDSIYAISVRVFEDGKIVTYRIHNSVGDYLKLYQGPTNMAVDVWYHIVCTWDGTNADMYVNGFKDTPYIKHHDNVGSQNVGSKNFDIGKFVSGFLDDVRIYNRALSSAEIAAIYNATR